MAALKREDRNLDEVLDSHGVSHVPGRRPLYHFKPGGETERQLRGGHMGRPPTRLLIAPLLTSRRTDARQNFSSIPLTSKHSRDARKRGACVL
eukprot:CAMPEP_0177756058 /NCGR_PEP_ID=MMETSP0491_2-20121128/2904_1 /TAXON_ID=63592 /ORGANISM="Tetraselmis chuii, Strain PLY429" /LENGTH=92 /DNA_ID=CAMNT_0019271611 /DNA_START=613 /DNA_END=891 /DNA_ORIENTATION=-